MDVKMKIALCSDLHLEFDDIILKNDENAELLILSGDIMIAEDLHNHPETSYGMYMMSSLPARPAKATASNPMS
jgi:predicted phosphodiesterase